MPFREDGEILFVSRRSLLLPTVIGAVFLAVGVWAARVMVAQGDTWALWIWGSFWFLGSGAALLSGLWGLLVSRPRFARLGDDGLQLYRERGALVPWSHILEARLGPKKTRDAEGTHYAFSHPLILRLRDSSCLPAKSIFHHAFALHPLPDGTQDWMVALDGCPCDERDFLAKIQARLHPGTPLPQTSAPEPILPVLGVHRLDRPPRPSLVAPLFSSLFIAFGLFFAAKGFEAHRQGVASLTWPVAKATITESRLESGGKKTSLRVRYVYQAQGKNLTGTRVAFASYSSDAHAWARRFSADSLVDVHYNPSDPSDSVLVPGNQKAARFITGFGLVFAAGGSWPIIAYVRARRRLAAWLRDNPDEPRV